MTLLQEKSIPNQPSSKNDSLLVFKFKAKINMNLHILDLQISPTLPSAQKRYLKMPIILSINICRFHSDPRHDAQVFHDDHFNDSILKWNFLNTGNSSTQLANIQHGFP